MIPLFCYRVSFAALPFLFIDEKHDRIAHLRNELSTRDIPLNYHIYTEINSFDGTLTGLLDDLDRKGARLAPTFAFIDPFGFKGAPFSLVQRLLRNPSTEVFINVMTDSVNRFLVHSGVQQHIVDLFGTREVMQVARSSNRIDHLRLLYLQQLQREACFVRYFEMCNECDRKIYYLFFASNHRVGHIKMKEAFWRVDNQGGYRFSDRTNPQQPVLFALDPAHDLASVLQDKYAGQTESVEVISHFVEDETAFTAAHTRKALAWLEQERQITVNAIKSDGKKRRKNTFPDGVILCFPE